MRGTRIALWLAVPLLSGGCVDAVVAPDRTLPEQRGTQIGAAAGVSEQAAFAWSADGTRIFYRSSGEAPSLAVVDVTGGAPVGLVSAWTGHRDLRPAADGRALYFVADTGGTAIPVVFRLPLTEGAPVGLGRTIDGGTTRAAEGSAVLPTPAADTAALIVAPDSVVLDGPGLRTFVQDGCERLVAYSPDGTRLLCVRTVGSAVQYRILELATATLTAVDVVGDGGGQPLSVVWTGDGIRTLFFDQEGYGVYDVTSMTARLVAPLPGSAFVADGRHAVLSADGSRAAYWTYTCLEAGTPGECSRGQSVLTVVDLVSNAQRVAAVASGASAGNAIAFSPDGAQLAYVVEGTLYVVPVP